MIRSSAFFAAAAITVAQAAPAAQSDRLSVQESFRIGNAGVRCSAILH